MRKEFGAPSQPSAVLATPAQHAEDHGVSRRDGPAGTVQAPARPPTAPLWFVTAFVAAAPAWLLYTNAEGRLPQLASTGLLVAGVVALVVGAACARRSSSRLLLPAGAVVVLLCVAAPLILEVDGRVSPAGWILFGGAAGVLAVLATVLTLMARTGGAPR